MATRTISSKVHTQLGAQYLEFGLSNSHGDHQRRAGRLYKVTFGLLTYPSNSPLSFGRASWVGRVGIYSSIRVLADGLYPRLDTSSRFGGHSLRGPDSDDSERCPAYQESPQDEIAFCRSVEPCIQRVAPVCGAIYRLPSGSSLERPFLPASMLVEGVVEISCRRRQSQNAESSASLSQPFPRFHTLRSRSDSIPSHAPCGN